MFNYNQFSLSFPDTERYGGFVNAEHKIWGDRLVAYADLFYQNVKVHNELAPSATGPFLRSGIDDPRYPATKSRGRNQPGHRSALRNSGWSERGRGRCAAGRFQSFQPLSTIHLGRHYAHDWRTSGIA